jgi:16S rRNA (guanine527-N7)-methyltransferase
VLARAQARGAIGAGPVEDAVAHALDFFAGLGRIEAAAVVDLGSGGGLPGLPLALAYPRTTWWLVDAWAARVDALRDAIATLGLGARVEAVHARAEDLGRGALRGRADVVVARGFGDPALTAEYGAPLLRSGGRLVVSVAQADDRWPARVESLGLEQSSEWSTSRGAFRAYRLVAPVGERFPRRPAAQRRRPLF